MDTAHRLGIGVQETQQGEPWNAFLNLLLWLDGKTFTRTFI